MRKSERGSLGGKELRRARNCGENVRLAKQQAAEGGDDTASIATKTQKIRSLGRENEETGRDSCRKPTGSDWPTSCLVSVGIFH